MLRRLLPPNLRHVPFCRDAERGFEAARAAGRRAGPGRGDRRGERGLFGLWFLD
jgi:hypothetical protein